MKKFYHNIDLDSLSRSAEIVEAEDVPNGFYGPFKSFDDAKKDAEKTLNNYIRDFKTSLSELNKIKKAGQK